MSKAQELIKKEGLVGMIITDPYNMRHISGFRGGEGALYISATQQVLITDSRYTEQAEKESDFTIVQEHRGHTREQIFAECLEKEEGTLAIGYEDQSLLCSQFDKMKKALPVKEWVPMGGKVDVLRRIKTAEEIEYLAQAEHIGDVAFSRILDFLKPGVSELEVAAELEYQMKKEGAETTSFNSIIASGLNSSMPHAIPSEKKLEVGDFVTMDFGCLKDGYCSDMTRTVAVGHVTDEMQTVYDTVLNAQLAGIAACKAGVTGRDVDAAGRKIIEAAGYGDAFGHGFGHGVGLEIHEAPVASPRGEAPLPAGSIVTAEPGIYLPGKFGVRIEDMLYVIEDGCIDLTDASKQLIIL